MDSPGPPRILIHSLVVTNGHVGFADLTRKTPFRTAYAPINLEIAGSIDPVEDRDALARGLVQGLVKAARLGELSAIGRSPPDADASFRGQTRVTLSPN
ncbi:MAG: DUF748 domain-containing protein [Verrucomicrobia bacterium]|jgi:hypothetical protein|nr:DUF748 domain-containing protein [Verrucomicrobiota bacterium]OQC66726.1 MAG: hypothetical protein BWX48_01312 [Verrucomicrobia bacterium ADurb.Bin006]MDI9381616.1 DUF748 domain-containing protein [Verrucomicrobiota bacterium]NMD20383.1 DUF748 domain-containing protein [Verrucomicrobiota bacterium]HOA60508.1 DUF748 domain-containing protein [Verrucomicrobiota bacterium]